MLIFSPLRHLLNNLGKLLSYSDNNDSTPRCRPFNSMEFKDDIIIKLGLNEQGKKIAIDEGAWYKHVKELGYACRTCHVRILPLQIAPR